LKSLNISESYTSNSNGEEKKMIRKSYFVLVLMTLFFSKCNYITKSNNNISSHKINTNINALSQNNTKENILNFCNALINDFKNNDTLNLINKTVFPLQVECFSDKSKGILVEMKSFSIDFDNIFGDNFLIGLIYFKDKLNSSQQIDDYEVGVDLRDSTSFTVSIQYKNLDNVGEMTDEYSRLFHFKMLDGDYKLVCVSCAG